MNRALDLQRDKISSLFINYLIPAITSGLVTSLYIIVDGIFIGKGIGSNGLAAVGVVVPLFTIFTGFSLLFAIGGSVLSSISLARGDNHGANNIFSSSIIGLSIVICIFISVVFILNQQILHVMGAEGVVHSYATTYLKTMVLFGIAQVLALALSSFIRMEGYPKLAMGVTVLGALSNILLDYIFIFVLEMGIFGAALATGFGNTLSTIIFLIFFIRKRGKLRFIVPQLSTSLFKSIFLIGLPTFMDGLLLSLVIIIYNARLFNIVGDDGVSAFSIVGYLLPFIIMFFSGLAQALQPIISANFGSGNLDRIKEVFNLAIKTALLFGVLFTLVGLFGNRIITRMFLPSVEPAFKLATQAIPIIFASYLPAGLVFVINSYFQSVKKPEGALILALLRGLFLIIPLMFILSTLYNSIGMWYAFLVTEILTLIVAITLKRVKG